MPRQAVGVSHLFGGVHGKLGRDVRRSQAVRGVVVALVAQHAHQLGGQRIVEQLANQAHNLELDNAQTSKIWEYRKAAWSVEDMEEDIGLVYKTLGLKGLQSIPNMNLHIGMEIEALIKAG